MHQAKIVTFAPTCDTSIYASGDQIGSATAIEIANVTENSSGGSRALSLTVIDKARQNAALDVLFFSQSPTVASSDNGALNITDAEMASKCIGIVSVESSDYKDLLNSSVATLRGIDLILQASKSSTADQMTRAKSVYAMVCSRGAPTYASSSDLQFKLGVIPL